MGFCPQGYPLQGLLKGQLYSEMEADLGLDLNLT
jgi:hypothetical protein